LVAQLAGAPPPLRAAEDLRDMHDYPHGGSLCIDMDAYARDFTINAIYYDPAQDQIIDPTGRGLRDLADRRLRFVLDPTVALDPVLAARWIKFFAKGFMPASASDAIDGMQEVRGSTPRSSTQVKNINRTVNR
jgi:hypothetical protein